MSLIWINGTQGDRGGGHLHAQNFGDPHRMRIETE
jgi:hypothetical protein